MSTYLPFCQGFLHGTARRGTVQTTPQSSTLFFHLWFYFFPIFFPYNRGEEDFDGLCLLLRSSSSETGWCLRPLAHLPSLQVPIDKFPWGLPNSRMVYGIYGP